MKSFAILGVGHFGFYLGRHLYKKGHDVIAVDINKNIVQKIKDNVSEAVVADASERDTLVAMGIGDVDTAVVCIGTRMQVSILTTLQLKEIGVKRIIAKATSEDHGLILKKSAPMKFFFLKRTWPLTWLSGWIIRICWITFPSWKDTASWNWCRRDLFSKERSKIWI